jgi:DHA2 family multidrug resistance protein
MALAYGTFFGNVVLLPLWLQQYMGYTATQAGMVLAPVGLLAILLTPLVGRTLHKVDPRIFATAAFLIFALVLFMRSQFATTADFGTLMIPTIIQGAAVSVFFSPLVTLSLSGLSPERIPAASGLFNFARITAGSFGTSIATTSWDHRATLHHAHLVERLGGPDAAASQALASMQASGLTPEQSQAMLNRLIDQQAFMLSANDVFYASAVLFLLLIAVVWLAKPAKSTAQGSQAAAAAH